MLHRLLWESVSVFPVTNSLSSLVARPVVLGNSHFGLSIPICMARRIPERPGASNRAEGELRLKYQGQFWLYSLPTQHLSGPNSRYLDFEAQGSNGEGKTQEARFQEATSTNHYFVCSEPIDLSGLSGTSGLF